MHFWHFSETPYPGIPDESQYDSVRATMPSSVMDPEVAADLWDRYIREWQIADQAGLNIMVNEHHATATCLDPAGPVVVGALARLTEKARILLLGNPVANRSDPVRVAEEMALIDILSRGRLEVGFVRGVPYEVAPANSQPVMMGERMWESIDLIRKAWTTHDGPFNWEGQFFHQRQVNIWPRPYQNPSPRVWVSTTSPGSASKIAENDAVVATFLQGYEGTRKVFQTYRDRLEELGQSPASEDMFAYCALVYTGTTDEEGMEGARKLLWYLQTNKVPFELSQPPGYSPYQLRAMGMQGKKPPHSARDMTLEQLIDDGIVFAGSPATVRGQIERFYERVGGFGQLLMMGQAGHMNHRDTIAGIENFAEYVKPHLDSLALSSR